MKIELSPVGALPLWRQTVGLFMDAGERGCADFIRVVFLLMGLVFLAAGFLGVLGKGHARTQTELFFSFLLGTLCFVVGVGVFARFLRSAVARRKLGPVQVEVNPTTLRPGERLNCTVEFQPQGKINLTESTAKLRAKEWVMQGRGGRRSRRKEDVLYEQPAQLSSGGTAVAGESVRFQANLTVPSDALPSFWASSNRLLWSVEVELKLRHWPDWTHAIPITVRP